MTKTDTSIGRQVQATSVLNLHEVAESWHIVNVSVSPNHDPILLLSSDRSMDRGQGDRQTRTTYRIAHFSAQDKQMIDLPEFREVPGRPLVQPLEDHHWLFVDGAPGDNQVKNATVFDSATVLQNEFRPGRCIIHMQTTSYGTAWLGYGDEGIFNSHESTGSGGLVCIDRYGTVLFSFNDAVQLPSPHWNEQDIHCLINMDTMALNVASDYETWLYYYNPYPDYSTFILAQIGDSVIDRCYRNIPVLYASAFAVHGDQVLFAGSYDEPQSLFHVSLRSMAVQLFIPVDESGSPITFNTFSSIGRGSRLYLNTNESLYMIDLADVRP